MKDPQMFQLVMFVMGLLLTILTSLVAYIWKTGQAELRSLKTLIEQHKAQMDGIASRVVAIEGRCQAHDKTDVSETALRRIVREEMETSMNALKESLTLSLIEKGYIATTKTKQRKTAVKK